ncbi:hypothetical protein [Serinicoccus sp. CUA-874]|uniref:hypothetical protein n=1 Tax=Serinicoccus sp. CUA-874 TaxID=1517939 RepID=UPI001EDA3718|nr:hypothetical protein [Serinicoccus sp. CUA-874]
MTWVFTALLIGGIALLAYTLARVLAGGLVHGPTGAGVPGRPAGTGPRTRHLLMGRAPGGSWTSATRPGS